MKQNKGVLTVEAALMVPLFIFAILFMTQFMKVVYVYDTVQTNIYNTAKFANAYSSLNGKIESVAYNKIREIQEIFTSVTGDVIGEDGSNEVSEFIGEVLSNGFEAAGNAVGGKMCLAVLKSEFNGKEKWLGMSDFDTKGTIFKEKEIKLVVNYKVRVQAPFINIDKQIPLTNQVVIKNLGS